MFKNYRADSNVAIATGANHVRVIDTVSIKEDTLRIANHCCSHFQQILTRRYTFLR